MLGSPIGEHCRKELLDEKLKELDEISDVIDKLGAHYGFYLLKSCFSIPKLLYFFAHESLFLQIDYLESYDKLIRNSAFSAFLAPAVGAKYALSKIFGLEHVDGTYDEALKRWFELG